MGISSEVKNQTIAKMMTKFDSSQQGQIKTGVSQVAERWKSQDGNADIFTEFCLNNFISDPEEKTAVFSRYQHQLESLYGNLHQISREFSWALHVDIGPVYPVDYMFANFEPFAHVSEDFFKTKIAFLALLNYPIHSLEEKNDLGLKWSRKKWAEVRLVEEFKTRVPSTVAQQRSEIYVAADDYISNYNIYMHRLLDEENQRLFPEDLKLISHWGLRDELKAQYANSNGFSRQKMIQQVMERIIRQEIPQRMIDSEQYDWNPYTNTVLEAGTQEQVQINQEPNIRYQHLLNTYRAEKALDPYYPQAPSLIDRRFKVNRELTEAEVESLLTAILKAPVLEEIAGLIENRLGRPLEPFDIWYDGFQSRSQINEEQLDKKVAQRYPSVEAFENDLPYLLREIGFDPKTSEHLAQHIEVDPSRGAGHAMGAMMRSDHAHLRTRIPDGGMKYKGFNIAIHELGHNVEQVFSLNAVDYYTLNGVPNTAFTEAFAFVFQSRDLALLGYPTTSAQAEQLRALNDMWSTFEIAGVALTDMYIWRWMYDHPEATPEQLKQAMLNITKQVWNDYFASVLGMNNQILLAVYSHIIDGGMYTPDYPLGHIISFQTEEYLKQHNLATEMERMCKLGRLSPQIWMQNAVNSKISADPLISAAEKAVQNLSEK
jgi:hypothetical protein